VGTIRGAIDEPEIRAAKYDARTYLDGGPHRLWQTVRRSVPCLVTETSSRGARIWTTYAVRLPEKFHLHIGHDDDAGRSAYAVWRTGAERGLCFERTAAARRLLLPLPTLLMRWRGLPGAGALP
jgi:hypothetical protein